MHDQVCFFLCFIGRSRHWNILFVLIVYVLYIESGPMLVHVHPSLLCSGSIFLLWTYLEYDKYTEEPHLMSTSNNKQHFVQQLMRQEEIPDPTIQIHTLCIILRILHSSNTFHNTIHAYQLETYGSEVMSALDIILSHVCICVINAIFLTFWILLSTSTLQILWKRSIHQFDATSLYFLPFTLPL